VLLVFEYGRQIVSRVEIGELASSALSISMDAATELMVDTIAQRYGEEIPKEQIVVLAPQLYSMKT